ncbi:NLR family CARD domain-containing protein 3 [Sarotherodon galilaeus]
MPFIAEVKNRWPALFSETEFTRITMVPLLSTFMAKLDHYADHLLRVFKKKGGTAKHSINLIMAAMDGNPSVDVRRECILKAVCVYLNEKPDDLFKEFLDVDLGASRETEQPTLGVYVVRHEGANSADTPKNIGVIIEGCTVLQALGDHLKYTFEFLQKVLMELDGNNLSMKVQVLKNKLLE